MTINNLIRRTERLEIEAPEQGDKVRVLFRNSGDPDPVADPPLLPNERAIIVTFVRPSPVTRL
ncbi:hypothetical protein ASE75_13685 [Sphingomonas sp. Leaf17]|uniref:hypothetical protein n=1 Tax=Sphingomonas sp. Leaf17 TaxID=1735683 RepID=UPI0006FD6978|nr:hypothetical protein [Sphingomonas sp. Leaf17]KQM62676.1 hypothetical protein ASE75_13685 [Sphingomonas sp. Leaf17]